MTRTPTISGLLDIPMKRTSGNTTCAINTKPFSRTGPGIAEIAQGDTIHSHPDDNDQQQITRPSSSSSSIQQHANLSRSNVTTTIPVVVGNSSHQQRQEVTDEDTSSRAAIVDKALYNNTPGGGGLGIYNDNANCEVFPAVSLITSSMEYPTNKTVSADDQTNDSHSSSVTTSTELSSSSSEPAAAVLANRTLLKDRATTNAAATLLQVATSTADKKQNNILCKPDNTVTTNDNETSFINRHHDDSHQPKSDTTLRNNMNEACLIGNKRKTPSPILGANTTTMDENSVDISNHHRVSYHHKQRQQYTSTTPSIPTTTSKIRRDSLPMGLRNKKMKPTDCLLFAATLLDQEVPATDNNEAFTETRKFHAVSNAYDSKNCTAHGRSVAVKVQKSSSQKPKYTNGENLGPTAQYYRQNHHHDDPGGGIPLFASLDVQQQQQQQQQQLLGTRAKVASKSSPCPTMISLTRSTQTNKAIQQQQQHQLELVAPGVEDVIVKKHKLQEEVKKPKQKYLGQDHSTEDIVTANKPKDVDVMCGRGGKVNKHPGNVVYRKIVEYNKLYYQSVHKKHRILVSKSIVQAIHNNGGRFMGQQGSDEWVPIVFKRAVQKTSQALRERSNNNSNNNNDDNIGSSSGSARTNTTNTDGTKIIRQHSVLAGDQVIFSA